MLVSLFATLAAAAASQAPASGEILTREQAEARLANCGSRRFESIAEFEVDGKMKRSRLELCAKENDTQADWIATLERNEAQIKAQTGIPESARFKLLSDLRGEIERLKGVQRLLPETGALASVTAPAIVLPKAPVVAPSSDFEVAALPPLPAPKPAGSIAAGGSSVGAAGASVTPAAPRGMRPRLSVKCAVPGGNPLDCDYLSLGDLFFIEAEENLASPLTLTFRRTKTGDVASVSVRRLKQGDMVSLKVPPSMCKGVVKTTFEVQINGAGTGTMPYLDTLGPFRKAC